MGQKFSDASKQSRQEFMLDVKEVLDEDLFGVKPDEVELLVKSLRLKFKCSECKNKWESSFSKEGKQACPVCTKPEEDDGKKKKKKKYVGKVSLPEDRYLLVSVECKKCDLVFKRPGKPKKIGTYKCQRCGKRSNVVRYGIGEGDYKNAIKEYLGQGKKFEEKIKESVREEVREEVMEEIVQKEQASAKITEIDQEKLEEIEVLDDDDDDEKTLCKICSINDGDTVLIPCGHLICHECAKDKRKCPFPKCKKRIGDRIKLKFE